MAIDTKKVDEPNSKCFFSIVLMVILTTHIHKIDFTVHINMNKTNGSSYKSSLSLRIKRCSFNFIINAFNY